MSFFFIPYPCVKFCLTMAIANIPYQYKKFNMKESAGEYALCFPVIERISILQQNPFHFLFF